MNTKKEIIAYLSEPRHLFEPNYHKLNEHAGRNDRLLHALMCAYAKHALGNEDIGWEKLSCILHAAICQELGDAEFCDWVAQLEN